MQLSRLERDIGKRIEKIQSKHFLLWTMERGEKNNMGIEDMWDELLSLDVCEQTLSYITKINGYSKETLQDVLYVHVGFRCFDDLYEDFV